jgi:hypothetical protein
MKGGNLAQLQAIIDSVPMKMKLTVNPGSRFVVATYWWGRGNINANLQKPCPEDILEGVKEILEEELTEEDPEYKELFDKFDSLSKKRKEGHTPEEAAEWKRVFKERLSILNTYFARDPIKERINAMALQSVEAYRKKSQFREPKTYDKMIEKWEQTCEAMGCNYLTAEYPQFLVKGGYQLAINAKPVFIKKALEATEGRGILYIDGDMFIRKYPKIFDMPNIDFAARSWNADPRANSGFKEEACFDPYIFETSGGTMFFANSPKSKELLDAWTAESLLPKNTGKADDRILSQVYTVQKYAPKVNILHLPIEYLWLTDLYSEYKFEGLADEKDCVIDHPYCLTGEERAAEMSQSLVDRQPPGYTEQLENIVCNKQGGTFYEYIFFLHKEEMVDSYGPYLKYMKATVNPSTGEKIFEVVDFSEKYGRYSATALKNLANGRSNKPKTAGLIRLALLPSIVDILGPLMAGQDVMIGSHPIPSPDMEFSGRNIGTELDPYLANIKLDHSSSMYISAKNPIVIDLLAMCKTLEDVNIHLKESFMFLSRIRWLLTGALEQAERIPGAKKKGQTSMELF